MKRHFSGFIAVTSFALTLLLSQSFTTSKKNVYFAALVPKNANAPSVLRLAGEKDDFILSRQNPGPYRAATSITVTDSEDLFVVELNDADEDVLPLEVARFGRFALVKVWKQEQSKHQHFGDIKNFSVFVDSSWEDTKQLRNHAKSRIRKIASAQTELGFDEEQLKSWVEEFSGAKEVTLPSGTQTIKERGSKTGKDQARAWSKEQYEALGFTTTLHTYRSGENFLAERKGTDPSKTLIVSAHLDSVGNAGADDDGTGTISALAIAKSLQTKDLKYNLRIVGFDQEEVGLVGSKAYAKSLSGSGELSSILGVINIEMTGYDADHDGAFHAIHCNENTSKHLADIVEESVSANQLALKLEDACTNRSDHAAFWTYDAPAIVVSQNFFGGDSNPCYHLSCDKVNKINFDYMQKLTAAIAGSVHALLVEER